MAVQYKLEKPKVVTVSYIHVQHHSLEDGEAVLIWLEPWALQDSMVGCTAARAYMSVCTGLPVGALHIVVPVPLAASLF